MSIRISKKDSDSGKSWVVYISTGSGPHRKRFKRTFSTKSEAKQFAAEMNYQVDVKSRDFHRSEIYLPDSFLAWVNVYKRPHVTELTLQGYHATYADLKKSFPRTKLQDVDRVRMQLFFNQLGETKSKATLTRRYYHLKVFFVDQVNDGVVSKNPMLHIQRNGKPSKDESQKVLSVTDFETLRDAVFSNEATVDNDWIVAVGIGWDTGLRMAEVQALTWSDIDLELQTLTVSKSWDAINKKNKPPKSRTSNRTINISDRLASLLRKYHLKQKKWLLTQPSFHDDEHLLLGTKNGTVIAAPWINRHLVELERSLGFDTPVSFHGLRHSHASYLLFHGVTIGAVSKRLGHSSVNITERVYAHVLPEEIEIEGKKMMELLG